MNQIRQDVFSPRQNTGLNLLLTAAANNKQREILSNFTWVLMRGDKSTSDILKFDGFPH